MPWWAEMQRKQSVTGLDTAPANLRSVISQPASAESSSAFRSLWNAAGWADRVNRQWRINIFRCLIFEWYIILQLTRGCLFTSPAGQILTRYSRLVVSAKKHHFTDTRHVVIASINCTEFISCLVLSRADNDRDKLGEWTTLITARYTCLSIIHGIWHLTPHPPPEIMLFLRLGFKSMWTPFWTD